MQWAGNAEPLDPDPRHAFARGLRALDRALDHAVGARANPLRQLGALATFAFWLCVATGAYVYIGFDTSADGAWQSVRALESHPVEGPIKSLHRYSSFALLAFTLLHLAAEWTRGRYRGFRWFSWVTGLIPLWLAVACAMVGYWLIADTRAQYVAAGLGEWIGALPGVGATLMRNFITAEAISDRLLSLIIFLHIGVGLFLLLSIWVHLARLVRPQTWPAREAGFALAAALVALSVAAPALSGGRADFSRVPDPIQVDWLAYGLLPLMHATTPAAAWLAVAAVTAFFAALPWIRLRPRAAVLPAVVDAANCNGCRRCFEDCPYGAVTMAPHPLRGNRQIAVVRADQCAACGICVGACPSATPFRSVDELVTGIDLPQRPLDALRRRVVAALASAPAASQPIVVIGCDHGADVERVADARTIALSLPCSAALPPAFVEYATRAGAAAVLVADCGEHGCIYRFGGAMTRARLAGRRAPELRASARASVTCVAAAHGDERALQRAVADLRRSLPEPAHA